MGRVTAELELTNAEDLVRVKDGTMTPDHVRRLRVRGTVGSGANWLVLSRKMARELGVPTAGQLAMTYADRRTARKSMVENVRVDLLGRHGIFRAIVEPKRENASIGAIVLEDLDLLVDCRTQKLRPRDPNGITGELE
jgi:predicted aspartyl protease